MVAPCSTFVLSSYTQRPIFQDHFIKTGNPLKMTIDVSSKKNNDTQNIGLKGVNSSWWTHQTVTPKGTSIEIANEQELEECIVEVVSDMTLPEVYRVDTEIHTGVQFKTPKIKS